MTLTALDIAIVLVPLTLILSVSAYLQRYMKSVADFLAAGRCAGRYLIATAAGETTVTVMSTIVALEIFSRAGWSLVFWGSFTSIFWFILGLLGIVGYRFRQTRSLTFHQFFEVRYSRRMRIFASFLHAFSGCLTFGVQPALGARFFVYFCGMPESTHVLGLSLPTFVPVMLVLMTLSLYFALTGGQISVMVTDCLEGVVSSILYLVIAGFLIYTLSINDVRTAMLSGPPGASFVDPFDIGSRSDFNGWYVVIGLVFGMMTFRGNAWNQGFAASAKTPHEGRMAGILGNWRTYNGAAMGALVAVGAFTLLHNPSFGAQRAVVEQTVGNIGVTQFQSPMRMPISISQVLAPGIKGCYCAVLLFGMIAGQGQQLHNYGSTFLQDVFLPLSNRRPGPKLHVFLLKATVFGVAIFACCFSIWFKPVDALVLATALLGSLYMGGVGAVVWGGLYWRRGTTAGAWSAMLIGSVMSVLFFVLQQFWTTFQPSFVNLTGAGGRFGQYLAQHPDKIPVNGQQLTLMTAVLAFGSYIGVSLLTCRKPFDLDAMLHRGAHRLKEDDPIAGPAAEKRSWLARFLNIDEHFTRNDARLTYFTFFWTMTLQAVCLGIVAWSLLVGRLSAEWWLHYHLIMSVGIALFIAVPSTVWFTVGVTRDLWDLVRTLRTAGRNSVDDGTVVGHHNLEDETLPAGPPAAIGPRSAASPVARPVA